VLVLGGGVLLVYLLFWLPYKGMQLAYLWQDPDQVDAKRGGLLCAPADIARDDVSAVSLSSPYKPRGVWYELDARRAAAETATIVVLTAAAWLATRLARPGQLE